MVKEAKYVGKTLDVTTLTIHMQVWVTLVRDQLTCIQPIRQPTVPYVVTVPVVYGSCMISVTAMI